MLKAIKPGRGTYLNLPGKTHTHLSHKDQGAFKHPTLASPSSRVCSTTVRVGSDRERFWVHALRAQSKRAVHLTDRSASSRTLASRHTHSSQQPASPVLRTPAALELKLLDFLAKGQRLVTSVDFCASNRINCSHQTALGDSASDRSIGETDQSVQDQPRL